MLDAFLVRMTFGPAVMSLLGGKAWWLPRRLGRVLPTVDVEGAGLQDTDQPAQGSPQAGAGEALPGATE